MRILRTAMVALLLLACACTPGRAPTPSPSRLGEQQLSGTAGTVRSAVAALDGVQEARVWYHDAPPAGALTLEVAVDAGPALGACRTGVDRVARAAATAIAHVPENPVLRITVHRGAQDCGADAPRSLDEAAKQFGIRRG